MRKQHHRHLLVSAKHEWHATFCAPLPPIALRSVRRIGHKWVQLLEEATVLYLSVVLGLFPALGTRLGANYSVEGPETAPSHMHHRYEDALNTTYCLGALLWSLYYEQSSVSRLAMASLAPHDGDAPA